MNTQVYWFFSKHKLTLIRILFLVIITLAGILVFIPLFTTAIFGDDWQLLWIAKSFVNSRGAFLPTVANSYLLEVLTFYFMPRIFGYASLPYYAFSFILRIFVSFTLFWFLKKRNLSDIAAFLAGLLFMVSPIGLEATIMMRNFDSYLGMILLLITLDIVIRLDNIKKSISIIILSILELLINTIRSPGFFIAIFFTLTAKILLPDTRNKKTILLTLISISAIFLLVGNSALFGGQLQNLSIRNFPFGAFLYSYMGNIGRAMVPYIPNELPSFLLLSGIFFVWNHSCFLKKNLLSRSALIISLGATAYIGLKILGQKASYFNSFLMGIYFFLNFAFVTFSTYLKRDKEKFINVIIVFISSFAFVLTPTIRMPHFSAGSDDRYLVYTAFTAPLICAFFIQQIIAQGSRLKQAAGVLAIFLLIYVFALGSVGFLRFHESNHNILYTEIVWGKIKPYLDKYDLKNNKVEIIFLTDTPSYSKVNATVHFGFMFHAGIVYEIWNEDQLPVDYLVWTKDMLEKQVSNASAPNKKRILIEIIDTQVKELPFPKNI